MVVVALCLHNRGQPHSTPDDSDDEEEDDEGEEKIEDVEDDDAPVISEGQETLVF